MKNILFIAIITLLSATNASAQNTQVIYVPQQNFPPVSFNLRPVPSAHQYGKEWDLRTEWEEEWAAVINTNRYFREDDYTPGSGTKQKCILYITRNPMKLDGGGKGVFSPSYLTHLSGMVVLKNGQKMPIQFPVAGVIDWNVFMQPTYPGTDIYINPVAITVTREHHYRFSGDEEWGEWFIYLGK